MTEWIDGKNGWWTRKIPDDGFCIYVCERQDKWYVKISNLPMLGPFEKQAEAFFAAERKALDIANQVRAELNTIESEAT
jgi:hypothetical protein